MTSQSTLNIRVRIVLSHTLLLYSRLEDCTSYVYLLGVNLDIGLAEYFEDINIENTLRMPESLKNNGNHIKVMKNIETTKYL